MLTMDSVDAYQTALQIQTVVFQNQEDSQYRQATLLEEFTTQRTESRRANERLQHSIADVSATGREQARIDTKRHEELLLLLRDLQLRQPSGPARIHAYDAAPLRDPRGNQAINGPITDAIAPSTVRITATMATNRCPPICKCCCHVRTSFATPRYLQRFLGQLMLDYTSLLQPKACNYPPCKKRPGKSQFTYVFPTWFASRTLIVNGTSGGLTGIGASWNLRIPFILSSSDMLWRCIEDDNLSSLTYLISRNSSILNVVDENGYSPMLVRHFSPFTVEIEALLMDIYTSTDDQRPLLTLGSVGDKIEVLEKQESAQRVGGRLRRTCSRRTDNFSDLGGTGGLQPS